MTIAKLISYCIAVAMAIVIYWAQTQVSLFDSPIPQLPWGVVSLVDLYAGFTLFGLWIAYKETVLKTFLEIYLSIAASTAISVFPTTSRASLNFEA